MIQKGSNIYLFILALLLNLSSIAQFRYTASLDPVKESGFYSIAITPVLSSYLKTDLSDLRIVDDKKMHVPFIIDRPYERRTHHALFFDQKIISKTNTDSTTILLIENPGKEKASNLVLELKSAAAERIGTLSGSDDRKNWFIILDSLLLQQSTVYDDTSRHQQINFPASTYRYFKLTVYNNKKEPLNIITASSAMQVSSIDTLPPYINNPRPKFLQADSGSYSMVKIISDRPFQTSMIRLVISNPSFYKRKAKLFPRLKNSLAATWFNTNQAGITISSDHYSGHGIPMIKSDTLYLIIENGDNPPLHISSIETGVINRNIIAFLEKDKSYALVMDDPAATAPVYDLEHFKDRIPRHSSINIKEISALPIETASTQKQAYKRWIWPVIILLLVLLSFMTWKLIADMKKRNN
jgi:hypothetical protein